MMTPRYAVGFGVVCTIAALRSTCGLDNGLAKTPPMGWVRSKHALCIFCAIFFLFPHRSKTFGGSSSPLPTAHPPTTYVNVALHTRQMSWERFRCNVDCTADPDNCFSDRLVKQHVDILGSDEWHSTSSSSSSSGSSSASASWRNHPCAGRKRGGGRFTC